MSSIEKRYNKQFEELEELDEELTNVKESKKEKKEKVVDIKEYFLTKGCSNIFKHLSNVRIFNKNSASSSIIIFATLNYNDINNKDIVLKITYKPLDPTNNSLDVEEQIYRNVISNLLNNNHTPHLIEYIASIHQCAFDYSKYKFDSETKKLLQQFSATYQENFDLKEATITILSKTTGKTLLDTIQTINHNQQIILIFQLLFTLLCFKNITLRHNDLHFGNIFVENIPSTVYNYRIDNYIIPIKQSLLVKIYDFDRGSIYLPSVSRNYEIDLYYCNDFKQCATINDKADLQAIISTLWYLQTILSPDLVKWIKSITSSDFRKTISKREFFQTAETDNIPNSDLQPLNNCLKSLLELMITKKIFKLEQFSDKNKYDNLYTIPAVVKVEKHYPITTKTFISSFVETDIKGKKLDKIPIEIINLLNSSILFKQYYDEFLILSNYNILEKGLKLFNLFYLLKPVKTNIINSYLKICILMSIPFWYKSTNAIKSSIYSYIYQGTDTDDQYDPKIEANIWNIFFNKLPVSMPLV